jgi:beta-lactamase class A
MSIYMKNLSSGEELAIDSDTVYETFSVIKLAIAAELMHQVESGKFSLTDRVPLNAGNERLPSGVLYTMDPGLTPTVKDLLTLMIIISDNEATDALGDKVGRANVTAYMQNLGLEKTSIQFSDLDWDRTWLGTLDPAYKNAVMSETDLLRRYLFRPQDHLRHRPVFRDEAVRQAGVQAGQRPDSGHYGKAAGQRSLPSLSS